MAPEDRDGRTGRRDRRRPASRLPQLPWLVRARNHRHRRDRQGRFDARPWIDGQSARGAGRHCRLCRAHSVRSCRRTEPEPGRCRTDPGRGGSRHSCHHSLRRQVRHPHRPADTGTDGTVRRHRPARLERHGGDEHRLRVVVRRTAGRRSRKTQQHLGALSSALRGRGDALGGAIEDADVLLSQIEPRSTSSTATWPRPRPPPTSTPAPPTIWSMRSTTSPSPAARSSTAPTTSTRCSSQPRA